MFSGLNRWNNWVNTFWDKNSNTYTGGGYRHTHKYASVPYTVLTTTIRGFVRPVMHHSVCFRQHRFMLSFCVPAMAGSRPDGIWLLETARSAYEAAGCMPHLRKGIPGRQSDAEILQLLLPAVRPPARREQPRAASERRRGSAQLPLYQVRPPRAGHRADGPADEILLVPLREALLEALKKVTSVVIRRSFRCRNCGTLVEVSEAKDRRTTFCSLTCRERWFSLHRKK